MPLSASVDPDVHYMQRALRLAAQGTALASPNPQVGCVLVMPRDTAQPPGDASSILAEGFHRYQQRDHAEIVALRHAAAHGAPVAGATAYVTLEPCSHHGRTGPCADALIAAGIRRVVIGTVDPNPLVSGQGIARLRAAGVEVIVGVCERQARDLIEAFAHFIRHRTPFVTLKAALSADGKLAPPPAQRIPGQPFWLTGPAAREQVQQLRHASDAVLTGIGTVLADDPALTDRTGLPRRRPLLRVVLDSSLRIATESQLVRTAADDLLLLCRSTAAPQRIALLRSLGASVEILPEEAGRPSLSAMLSLLGDRSSLSLLVEGGSQLNGALLNRQLVEKVVLFYAETELGDAALPFAEGIASPFALEQRLSRITRSTVGADDARQDARVTGYLRSTH